MKILYIADARSPIAKNWITHFIASGHEVHVISSYPCSADVLPGARVYQIPIAFSQLSRISHNGTVSPAKGSSPVTRGLAMVRTGALSRYSLAVVLWLGPLEIERHVQATLKLISEIAPDMVHAMRIPFEGILAAKATPPQIPLLLSVWGNDLTLFANRNRLIARQTRAALMRADALHCDCLRDLKLANRAWSFPSDKPAVILPGAGGLQTSDFFTGQPDATLKRRLNIADDAPVIINPRGFRGYVRNDLFFQAIPDVMREFPKAVFICTGMQGSPVAEKWLGRLAIANSVRLLPSVARQEMSDLFRLAYISVSPSEHDGTPNTLLEAMACGCFPVAGDIESIREWIADGENGLLCDLRDKRSLARAMIRALNDSGLRDRARVRNAALVAARADYQKVMPQAEEFYRQVAQRDRVIGV